MATLSGLLLVVVCFVLSSYPECQTIPATPQLRNWTDIRPKDRISRPISDRQRVALAGQRHPLARPEFVIGRAAPDLYMRRMVLVLRPDPAQDAALDELIRSQHDPASPYYHQWLTPQEFGQRFGISKHDLNQVIRWLQSFGMEVEAVPASQRTLVFSGTAAQVESAFHTPIRRYLVKGAAQYANASDPQIPEALSQVVSGVAALHNFHSMPMHVVRPNYTAASGAHFLMPQDWATIYNVGPLYRQGLDGAGQSIAVLGRVNIAVSDIRKFRSNAGLAPNDPQIIINGPDPGLTWCDDELESALDVEWAGAIANNAMVKFVTTKSGTSDGINLSAQYAVNHNVAPVISLSYGLCEAALGRAGNAFWNYTWAQAAAQGISVLVSSGDSGAAGCDSPAQAKAALARGVNGLCSSPYSTCVGGTQFDDVFNPSPYWAATNDAAQSSALSYIPELAWNESRWTGGLWAGGGGASLIYGKPAWQFAPGVPADAMRDVPDVALHASIQDAYVVQAQGKTFYASGTSAATPSLASVMALLLENAGASQGNANPMLYTLANQQLSGNGPAVFHDVTSGNISVPGLAGFNAGPGYDQATGLGSVDAAELVNHWNNGKQAGFSLIANVAGVSVIAGTSTTATLTMMGTGGFAAPAKLSSRGMPSGVAVKFSSPTITTSAPVTVTFIAAANSSAGNSRITISAAGGGLSRSTVITLTVPAQTFSVTPSVTSASLTAGGSTSLTISAAVAGGFKSAINFSASGMPAEVTATFSPPRIASPGSGSSTLRLSASPNAKAAAVTLNVKASGGPITRTLALKLTVTRPDIGLTVGASQVSIARGGSGSIPISTVALTGFRSSVVLSASALPSGVSASFSPVGIPAPGTGKSSLTLKASSKAATRTSTLVVIASGGGLVRQQPIRLVVK